MNNFDTLVLSGGGIKGLAILGALHYVHDQLKVFTNFKNYVGTSIGSIICYLLIIGYTPLELLLYFFSTRFDEDLTFNMINFFKGDGAVSFSLIETHLITLTKNKNE